MKHLSLQEYRKAAYTAMSTTEYRLYIEETYRDVKNMLKNGGDHIVPARLGIHLANTRCTGHCIFCVNGGTKFKERALASPNIFLNRLKGLLELADDHGNYIKEIHFDGDSADPVMANTLPLFNQAVDIIREAEKKDNRNRLIQVITNGICVHKIPDEILDGIDLFNISVNACSREIHEIFSGTQSYNLVMDNITKLCRYRDKNLTGQIINVSYVISRIPNRGLTNFFESPVEQFVDEMRSVGVNSIKFRFDFHETNQSYQEYVTGFIENIASSGKYKPLNIHVQQTSKGADFRFCLAPLLWPVLGTDIRLYSCPHAMKSELEVHHGHKAVPLVKKNDKSLCTCTCQPFMFHLNMLFNRDLKEDPELLAIIEQFRYSKNVYPIIRKSKDVKPKRRTELSYST